MWWRKMRNKSDEYKSSAVSFEPMSVGRKLDHQGHFAILQACRMAKNGVAGIANTLRAVKESKGALTGL